MKKRQKTNIVKEGQRYIDEQIFIKPRPLSLSIARYSCNYIESLPTDKYKRRELRWVKPDGFGGVMPA